MHSLIPNFHYRPEIDGLRAVAVIAVVLFHAGMGVPGGFVGVDVFFVISGFLITSLIVRDLQARTFSLAVFWERRIRRIVPALFVVVLATLAAGWFLLLPDDYAALGQSGLFQSVCAANVYFWRNTGYFDGAAEEMPLLHTWSLAVEEQFYLVLPLLLSGMFVVPKLRRRSMLLLAFGIGALCSLGLSVYGVSHHPSATFYLLPTRAWELLLGSVVAMLAPLAMKRASREILASTGLVAIVLPCFLYTRDTPFPGMAALPPCVGAALFIWAARLPEGETRASRVAKALTAPPLVFIGLISYSLYLWHWPLFAFSSYSALQPLALEYRAAMVLLALALSVLSWRYVETPFRTRQVCATRPRIYAFGLAATTLIGACGLTLQQAAGFPARVPPDAIRYAMGKADAAFLHELTTEDVVAGKLVEIGDVREGKSAEWLIWGDSHAMAALPAFDAFLKECGVRGEAATHSSTFPLLEYYRNNRYGLGSESPKYNESVLRHIAAHKIPNVVLVANWGNSSVHDPSNATEISFERALMNTVRRINEAGSRPWLLLSVPRQPFDVPRVLARFSMRQEEISPFCANPSDSGTCIADDSELVSKLLAEGVYLLDPRSYCLSKDGSHYKVAEQGRALYRDNHHLSTHGARALLLPMLRESIHHDAPMHNLSGSAFWSGR